MEYNTSLSAKEQKEPERVKNIGCAIYCLSCDERLQCSDLATREQSFLMHSNYFFLVLFCPTPIYNYKYNSTESLVISTASNGETKTKADAIKPEQILKHTTTQWFLFCTIQVKIASYPCEKPWMEAAIGWWLHFALLPCTPVKRQTAVLVKNAFRNRFLLVGGVCNYTFWRWALF